MNRQDEVAAECRWETPLAARYMTQLCKHWSHRLSVTLNEHDGEIAFEGGRCALRAGPDHLLIHITAEDEARLRMLEGVVIRHLQRFAFRDLTEEEAVALPWRAV